MLEALRAAGFFNGGSGLGLRRDFEHPDTGEVGMDLATAKSSGWGVLELERIRRQAKLANWQSWDGRRWRHM